MVLTEVDKVMVAAIRGLEVMVERCFGCNEGYAAQGIPLCRVFCDVRQRRR
jgi:hypothetical protein